MMEKKDIVVVIPIYKATLTKYEEMSLNQCVKVLADYPLVVVKPVSLDINALLLRYSLLKVENFSNSCFADLRAYNKLVLEEDFYQRFANYQYMLIFQLDAYVFRDELLDWARQGYDYIGAPWLPEQMEGKMGNSKCILLKRFFYRLIGSPKLRRWKYFTYEVGNGGFSLRNVAKMTAITHKYKDKIAYTEIIVDSRDDMKNNMIKKYNVTLVPTVILLNSDGTQYKRIESAIPKEKMEEFLKGLK